MREKTYRRLIVIAVSFTLAWLAWTIYTSFFVEKLPGDLSFLAANRFFEDQQYDRALQEYQVTLDTNPQRVDALRGKARALMQLQRYDEALAAFDTAIDKVPQFAGTYANRGILLDRMGRYEAAAADYEQALQLNPELAKGPKFITRFLRNQSDKQPSIAGRARYIREQLAKPEDERLLRVPEIDQAQRPYKL